MIPEYKLYHGAVLSEIIDIAEADIAIGELNEAGRLSSYILDQRIGLHIKHSRARLPPWQFTITKSNLGDLFNLLKRYRRVFVIFVCGVDGMATLSIDELASIIDTSTSDQAWVRVDRARRQRYSISGNGSALPNNKHGGVRIIVDELTAIN